MTVEKDWFSYLFEPTTLLADLKNLSDGQKVSLMKQFLSQAEMHDRRTANSSAAGAICVPDLQPQIQDTLLLPEEQQVYDKSKMLDTLALQIAASFNFHVNLFSGVVTELPLRLSSRLYRTLFLTVLAYSKDNGRPACSTTPYDLGPWESMEPLVAFTAFAYHLWCLQVAFSISLLPQPFRNMTPVVAGLQEVPDVAFLPDSRADLEAIMMRREESVARLVALSDLLQTEDRESSERSAVPLVTRPRASCFRFTTLRKPLFTDQADYVDALPRTRLLISTNFALGRLAFQHCLIDRAAKYFHVAHENLLIEKLSCIEEVDATPSLIEAYLAACQSYLVVPPSLDSETGDAEHITQALPATRTSPVKVVEEFCEYLVRELSRPADDTDFLSLSTFDSPTKQTLRISPSRAPPKDKRGSSKARKVSRSSLDALLEILRQDVQLSTRPDLDQYSTSCTVPLGVGPRFRTEQLTFAALRRLAGICRSRHSDPKGGTVSKSKARAKDLTMLRNLFLEWKTFYSKLVVSNAINAILMGSGFLSSPLIDELLATSAHTEESTGGDFAFTAVLDQDIAVEYLFDELSSLLQSRTAAANKAVPSQLFLHAKAQVSELLQFVGHLLVSVAQRSPVDVAASTDDLGPATRLMATTEAVLSSTLFEQLPESLRSFVQSTTTKLTPNPNLQRGAPSHLPDPAAPCAPFWPEDAPFGGGSSQGGGNAFPYNQQQQQDVDMRCVAATNRQSLPPSANDLATSRALLTSSDPTQIVRAAEEFLSFGWLPFDLLRQDAAWLPALLNLLRFSTPPAGFAFPAPQPLNDMPSMASGRRGFLSQADSQAGGSGSPGSGFISHELAHQQQQHLAELFASALTDQPPWCINALLLLAQGIVSRQHRLDLSTAHLLCCAALRQLPPNLAAAGVRDRPSASPVLWMRSLPRWLRSALDHELFLLDLLETSCAPSPSIVRRPGFNLDRAELVGRAKSLLLQAAGLSNDLGPDALISDELVAACACLLLLVGDYNFLTPRSPPAGPGELALPPAVFPMPASGFPALGPLEILRALMRLHYEVLAAVTGNGPTNGEEKETKQPANDRSPLTAAAHDLCFLLLGQKCLTGREPSAPSFAPTSSMESAGATWGMTPFGQSRWRPKDCPGGVSESSLGNGSGPANTSATLSGNSAGGGGSNPPSAAVSFESFAFLVWLLANCEPHPGSVSASDQREQEQHQQLQIHPLHNLLDCLLTCLAALLDILAPSFTPGWDFHLTPKLFLEHASTAVLPDNTDIGVFEQSPLGWRDIWPTSLPPASSKISPTTLYRLLDFCLDRAITRTPWRPDWLLLKADLEFASATSNGVPPRNVLNLLLEAGMVTSNFFSQPVPPSLYTERVVRLMVECCQSMGLIGEAVVLCQLAPNRSLLKLGVRLIESMCSGTSVSPESNGPNGPPATDDVAGRGNNQQPRPATSLDALDSLTDYIWELDLLEALANLEHERGSLSKRTKYLECINQPELSTCNAPEIVELTQLKRTSEFLRFLTRTYLA
ncbi:Integrator complex subunit 8 [Sparganum proliferum]